MSKWSKAAKLVNGVRDGLALLDDDERRRAIEALRSIVYEDMFGTGSQELLARQLGNGLYRIRRRDYQRMTPPYMDYWQKSA